jgi:RNA-directed DNA polymerase
MDHHMVQQRFAALTTAHLADACIRVFGVKGNCRHALSVAEHAFSGKALAVRRVTENQGKRTPGVDGVIWGTPEKKAAALHALRQRGYRPHPLRRVYIPKAGDQTRTRSLDIPVMADWAMQALYLLALDPIAETTADPNSYGFRKGRSTADAIAQCHTVLARKDGARYVLEGDIRSCFNRISHAWLEAHIPMDKAILSRCDEILRRAPLILQYRR